MSTIAPPHSAVLLQGLDVLDVGISVFDANLRLVVGNRRLAELFNFPPALMVPGTLLEQLLRFNAERGDYGPGDVDTQVAERLAVAQRFLPHQFERDRPNGMVLSVRGSPLPAGGFVTIYSDVTRERQRERALQTLTAELEARVAERTAALRHQSELLQQVVAHVQHGITMVNRDLVLELCNPQFHRIMRFPESMAQAGTRFEDFIRYNAERGEYGEGDVEALVRSRVEQARHPKPHHFERTRPDGSSVEVIGMPTGEGGLVTTYIDITPRKRAEAALRASEQRFHDFANVSGDWFFETDADHRFTYLSQRFLDITGLAPEQLLGKQRQQIATPESLLDDAERWQQHLLTLKLRQPYRHFEYPLLGGAGQMLRISVSAVPAYADGQFLGYRGTGTDITELHRAREALRHLAHYDTLTDIPNRRYFEDTLANVLARAARFEQRGMMALLDLDHFKQVNDTHGHPRGDALLQAVAARMSARLRQTDFLARIGGDEFALICERIGNDQDPLELVRELLQRVAEAAHASCPDCDVGASAGVAYFDRNGPGAQILMQQADAALYRAKAQGRGAVCVALA